jgi:hypothetical protein
LQLLRDEKKCRNSTAEDAEFAEKAVDNTFENSVFKECFLCVLRDSAGDFFDFFSRPAESDWFRTDRNGNIS